MSSNGNHHELVLADKRTHLSTLYRGKMASTACCSAFSPDGQYYAYCGNDGKLRIWETASGRLRHEYIPNQHLSSPCSVIGWVLVSQQSAGNASVRHAMCFLNETRLPSFALFTPCLSQNFNFPFRAHDPPPIPTNAFMLFLFFSFFFILFTCHYLVEVRLKTRARVSRDL